MHAPQCEPNNTSSVPALQFVLRRGQVQVQPQHPPPPPLLPLVFARRGRSGAAFVPQRLPTDGRGGDSVAPHVSAERLPHRELEPAYRALVGPRLRLHLCMPMTIIIVVIVGAREPRSFVACAVAAERLEGRELAVARLALEHAGRRRPAPGKPAIFDLLTAATDTAAAFAGEEHQYLCHVGGAFQLHCFLSKL